jgi:hypothetical protein
MVGEFIGTEAAAHIWLSGKVCAAYYAPHDRNVSHYTAFNSLAKTGRRVI